jgi:hypothetical protein
LVVPDEVASLFVVTGLKVGSISQLCGLGCLPAELFARSGPRFDLELDPVLAHADVLVEVQSTCDSAVELSVEVLGRYSRLPLQHKVIVGLGGVLVSAYNSVCVNVQPQQAFRPTHLFTPEITVRHFDVAEVSQRTRWAADRELAGRYTVEEIPDSARRGRAEVVRSTGQLSGRLTPIALRPAGTVVAGHFLTVSATNRSEEPQEFSGVVVGDRA